MLKIPRFKESENWTLNISKRSVIKYQEFKSAARKHQQVTRQAINDAILEPSSKYQKMTAEEIQSNVNQTERVVVAREVEIQATIHIHNQNQHMIDQRRELLQTDERSTQVDKRR